MIVWEKKKKESKKPFESAITPKAKHGVFMTENYCGDTQIFVGQRNHKKISHE